MSFLAESDVNEDGDVSLEEMEGAIYDLLKSGKWEIPDDADSSLA